MNKLLKFLWSKWYLLFIAALAIITQCYMQLLLPEKMGNIQKLISDSSNNTNKILIEGGWMILISFSVVILAFIQFYCASYVSSYVGKKLREEMYSKVNSISLADYNKYGTATLITRTTNDVEQIKNFMLMGIRILIMSPTMMIIALVKTINVQSSLLLILLISLITIILGMILLLYLASPLFKKIQEKIDNLTIVFREGLTGIRVVRAYNQEDFEYKKFDITNKDLTNTYIKVNRILSFANPFIQILFNFCFIGIYGLGFYLINNISGNVNFITDKVTNTITNISVVAQYCMQIMQSFVMFAMLFIMLPQASASIKRAVEIINIDTNKDNEEILAFSPDYSNYQNELNSLYDEENKKLQPLIKKFESEYHKKFNYDLIKYQISIMTEKDYEHSSLKKYFNEYNKIHNKYHLKRKEVRAKYRNNVTQNLSSSQKENIINDKFKNHNLKGIIEYKNVSFSYPDTDVPCIKNISFKTNIGETTAIIGSTGSGKSTIVNLIPKFYKVTSGEILLDGVNINELPADIVRDKIGFVPQTALLFKGSIKSNLLFGNKEASDDEIINVLKIAQAYNFVSKLPDGINSFVSQSGKNFSGGQKQRLCIARSLIKKAEIYIFDDSFSALDFKTDAKLRTALKNYTKDSSVIVVAQRVSSILDADNIIVLNEGEIVDQGRHEDLIKRCKVYQDIVASQLDKDEIEKTLKLKERVLNEGGNKDA